MTYTGSEAGGQVETRTPLQPVRILGLDQCFPRLVSTLVPHSWSPLPALAQLIPVVVPLLQKPIPPCSVLRVALTFIPPCCSLCSTLATDCYHHWCLLLPRSSSQFGREGKWWPQLGAMRMQPLAQSRKSWGIVGGGSDKWFRDREMQVERGVWASCATGNGWDLGEHL